MPKSSVTVAPEPSAIAYVSAVTTVVPRSRLHESRVPHAHPPAPRRGDRSRSAGCRRVCASESACRSAARGAVDADVTGIRSQRTTWPPGCIADFCLRALALYEGYASDSQSTLRSLAGQLNGLPAFASPRDRPCARWCDGGCRSSSDRVRFSAPRRQVSTRRTVDSLAVGTDRGAGCCRRDEPEFVDRVTCYTGGRSARRFSRGPRRTASSRRAVGHGSRRASARSGSTRRRSRNSFHRHSRDSRIWCQLANPDVHADAETATSKGTFTNRPKAEGPTTLPAFNPMKPTEPYWGQLRPFVLATGDECAPPPPPAYSEKPGSAFYRMGKEFHDTVRALTPTQRETALFWADNPVATGTPGFHWISVVNQMVARRRLTADQAAELYALTSIGIADAFISCWREKYRSLRRAAGDVGEARHRSTLCHGDSNATVSGIHVRAFRAVRRGGRRDHCGIG